MSKSNDVVNAYANFMSGWQVKLLGPKPSGDMLKAAAAFCGHGTPGKQCLALAMAMRACGVTAGHMQIACGGPQHNFRRGLVTEGHVKPLATPKNSAGHTVYRVELTAKGKALVAKVDKPEATAKPDAVAKSKARNAKKRVKAAKAPVAGAGEAVALEATPQAPVSGEAPQAQA